MKVLLDVNTPLVFGSLLANKGIENLRWSDVGAPNATDVEIMEYARDNHYIVLTYDLDFGTILSMTHFVKPSVAQIRASVIDAEQAVELVAVALLRYTDELERGAILTINLKKVRLRFLPI